MLLSSYNFDEISHPLLWCICYSLSFEAKLMLKMCSLDSFFATFAYVLQSTSLEWWLGVLL